MNRDSNKLHGLLHGVIPADGSACGPGRDALLDMVRLERARRRSVRIAFAVPVMAIVVAAVLLFRRAADDTVVVDAATPQQIVVHEVDDQQLLVLLKGTPAALMEWPDGQRTLLVMER